MAMHMQGNSNLATYLVENIIGNNENNSNYHEWFLL